MAQSMKELEAQAEEARARLELFIDELTWKKGKTDDDIFHAAICTGLMALYRQNTILLRVLRSGGGISAELADDGLGSVTAEEAVPVTEFSDDLEEIAEAVPVADEDVEGEEIAEAEVVDDEDIGDLKLEGS